MTREDTTGRDPAHRSSRKREGLRNLAISLCTTAVVLALLELGLRWHDGAGLSIRNFVALKLSLFSSGYPCVYDPVTGYIPRPGYSGRTNVWQTQLTIDGDGLRSNGQPPGTGPMVLAVGDSYTFGDQVSDAESWPAILERLTSARVRNGGVFGYGLDQIVLHAETLVRSAPPQVLIVAVIPDDVRRCEMSQRSGVHKPYFAIDGGRLALRGSPPSRERPSPDRIGWLRRIAGYSYTADWGFRRLGWDAWWYAGQLPMTRAHGDGEAVACALMQRLAVLRTTYGLRVIVATQYERHEIANDLEPIHEVMRRILACAAGNGLETIDFWDALRARHAMDPAEFRRLYVVPHMSPAGNRMIAEGLAVAVGGPAPS
ncbi:MAG: hypothetical protein U0166_06625 [Acidobacteriota bacterium]